MGPYFEGGLYNGVLLGLSGNPVRGPGQGRTGSTLDS